MNTEPLLRLRDLRIHFPGDAGPVRAVDGVTLEVGAGETVALVGESGCGKSVTALSILGLQGRGEIQPGSSIHFAGRDLLGLSSEELRSVRGAGIGMVFQEPMTSLNPVLKVRKQVAEAVTGGVGRGRAAALDRQVESLLERVGLPDPTRAARAYPHELSGGMRQRVMIAMAIARKPELLIADEPTTALDVTVQAQVLELLRSLRDETGMALLLISHDLAVVSSVADRVAVMYAGQVVEQAPARALFGSPAHPYTQGLLSAVPRLTGPVGNLAVIPGRVPHPSEWPPACRFEPRCRHAWDRCASESPPPLPWPPEEAAEAREVRCWLAREPDRYANPAHPTTGGSS